MRALLLGLSLLVLACGASPPPRTAAPAQDDYRRQQGQPGRGQIAFTFDRGEGLPSFFAAPWPSDLRRRAGGRPDLVDYPGRDHFALDDIFAGIEKELLGFSISPVIYLRLEGIDPAVILPSLRAGKIRLVDVDPTSPDRGRTHALEHRVYTHQTGYVPEGLLALRPRLPLAEDRLYALVVERELPGHGTLGTEADFELVKNTAPLLDPKAEQVRQSLVVTFDWLAARGVPRESIGALTQFRTQAASRPMRDMIEVTERLVEPLRPSILDAHWMPDHDAEGYRAIVGYYCTPNFQRQPEHAPFVERGGTIDLEDDLPRAVSVRGTSYHEPRCGDRMQARFSLAVPKGPMPKEGWPLLVYSHGTTGDAFSQLGEDGFAARAAAAGLAAVSTDQPLHGSADPRAARPGSRQGFTFHVGPLPLPIPAQGKGAELAFYNMLRPAVLRDNFRQAVVDAALLARLVLGTDFSTVRGYDGDALLSAEGGATPPRFDGSRGYVAAGHSQGSQSAAILGALDPKVSAVLLSAAGGDLTTTMIDREDSREAIAVLRTVLGLEEGELDAFHPLATILQAMVDPADPQSFGALYRRARPPRSVLMVQGAGDTMTLDHASAKLAATIGARPVGLLATPLPLLHDRGLEPSERVRANLAEGQATAAYLQIVPGAVYDGHFVAFREPAAMTAMEDFLRAVGAGRTPEVVARGGRGSLP